MACWFTLTLSRSVRFEGQGQDEKYSFFGHSSFLQFFVTVSRVIGRTILASKKPVPLMLKRTNREKTEDKLSKYPGSPGNSH